MNGEAAYSIGVADAAFLLALLNGETVPERSKDDLKKLLLQTVKLAESLSNNCGDWLKLSAIMDAKIHPYSADQLNVPTLRGALAAAVTVPIVEVAACCATCAFRVGSIANQTETVAEDVMLSLQSGGDTFYCHEGDGAPRTPCRGFVAAMKLKPRN